MRQGYNGREGGRKIVEVSRPSDQGKLSQTRSCTKSQIKKEPETLRFYEKIREEKQKQEQKIAKLVQKAYEEEIAKLVL